MSDERFQRTSLLLGEKGIADLQNSSVMIIGLGAVGGYALEAIARSGVGHLILVDFDSFDKTNINRQILALESSIGRKKTEVAKERVKQINPNCEVEIIDMFIDESNIDRLLSSKVDYVIDAIDSLASKCCLLEKLWQKQIPCISSMGAALKIDVEAIKITSLSKTKYCPLAKQVRCNLRRKGVDLSKIMCVCSEEEVPSSRSSVSGNKILGSLPTVTAIFGLVMANYVILRLGLPE